MAAAVFNQYNGVVQDTIRAFIAVHLPQEVKTYLGQLATDLAGQIPNRAVRWVKPERMHLTIRFIGETEKNLLPELGRALDISAAQSRPFSLHLEGFGCFPNCKRPSVLWAGVKGDVDAAASLKHAVDLALLRFGWETENRPFRPHLTIGRVKDSQKLAAQRWPEDVQHLAIPVTSIHLIESRLTPDGPLYTVCHSSRLQSA